MTSDNKKINDNNKVPNIIFFLADDMGAWAMNNAGNRDVITPNLDKLAKEGCKFDNFYCASPVCSPARASIMTGLMPSVHGVYDWIRSGSVNRDELGEIKDHPYYNSEDKAIRYLDGFETYPEILSQNGYDCRLSGKWHLGDSLHVDNGFSKIFTIARGGCLYHQPDIVRDGKVEISDQYITDLIAEDALKNLEEQADNYNKHKKPFYLSVHFTAPHTPWNKPDHPEEIWNLYDNCDFEATPSVDLHKWQLLSGEWPGPIGAENVEILNRDKNGEEVDPGKLEIARKKYAQFEEERKVRLQGYYTAISAMDKQIGRILTRLEELNVSQNTVVLFMSDNGMNLGQHGIWGKGNGTFPLNLYESSCKVPFIVRYPGNFPNNKVINNICSQLDIFPTLMELSNSVAKENKYRAGMSLLPLLTVKNAEDEKSYDDRPAIVVDEYGPNRMIRLGKNKLVKRYPYGPDELYDLNADPDEENNLIHEESFRELRYSLENKLRAWCNKYMDPEMDGSREAVTGLGQMARAGRFDKNKESFADSKLCEPTYHLND